MFKTNGTYVFDSIEAEYFHRYFNSLIVKYGNVPVSTLFTDPFLLGLDDQYLVRNEKDFEEFTKFLYNRVGWDRRIPTTKMFEIRKSKNGCEYEYVLTLPDYKEL